jgi:peptidyl-tRNA hydrolase
MSCNEKKILQKRPAVQLKMDMKGVIKYRKTIFKKGQKTQKNYKRFVFWKRFWLIQPVEYLNISGLI